MKKVTLIALLLSALCVHAQPKRVSIKLNLPPLADVVSFPALQGGIEVPVWGRLSWYNELGIRISKKRGRTIDTLFIPERGYKLRTEFRYYLPNKKKSVLSPSSLSEDYYFALNAFYNYDSHNSQLWYYNETIPYDQPKSDCFSVEKKVWGLNLLAGVQSEFSKNWYLDIYAGVGFRCRSYNITNMELQYKSDSIDFRQLPPIYRIADMAEARGSYSIVPNFTFSARIGYRF